MRETGKSISEWADTVFGKIWNYTRSAARANEEMAELLTKTSSGEDPEDIAYECADIVIVLARLANACGYDIFEMVDAKMKINRSRKWTPDGTGHGYHVKE